MGTKAVSVCGLTLLSSTSHVADALGEGGSLRAVSRIDISGQGGVDDWLGGGGVPSISIGSLGSKSYRYQWSRWCRRLARRRWCSIHIHRKPGRQQRSRGRRETEQTSF